MSVKLSDLFLNGSQCLFIDFKARIEGCLGESGSKRVISRFLKRLDSNGSYY